MYLAVSQLPRDPRQTRAEHEGLDLSDRMPDGVHELEDEPRVAVHRTGDVAEQHEVALFRPPHAFLERQYLAAVAQARAERVREVDGAPASTWAQAAREASSEIPRLSLRKLASSLELARRQPR